MVKVNGVKAKGFTAKKGEIASIKETGKATVMRKVKLVNGNVPEVCPLGKVGDTVWWREHLRMHGSEATIFSVLTSVDVQEVKGVPTWVIETEVKTEVAA